ncbi:tRNA isopentenyl-2-thiomethyl-A-37 hydroxylase MiaE [Algicola sagamiensis]|uniref:tRNA isopentenyl-2-thiomethyl-A-37 hydroxylase MiaE n=1 Tax=Algicola sagamiensis TaxID=163869 RepID=UPI0003730E44|nr:tRNA isopentenyl-2-thiomethyl-A-37 hydroxylase MiaE [Algicola sagamiensis]
MLEEYQQLLEPIGNFLHCETPQSWIDVAKQPEQLPALLIDHANCEMKAAMSAHSLVRRYCLSKEKRHLLPNLDFYRDVAELPEKAEILGKHTISDDQMPVYQALEKNKLLVRMVLLIQEELHHFEQVLGIMEKRGIEYDVLTASRYAKGMLKHVRHHEPAAIVDRLIIGAYIEARSCERFAKLAPYLDDELTRFYISLLRSEARHYADYLQLAEEYAQASIHERVTYFGEIEAQLILEHDPEFRFHSGQPKVEV